MRLPKNIKSKTFTNRLSKSYRSVNNKSNINKNQTSILSKSYRESDKKQINKHLKHQKFSPTGLYDIRTMFLTVDKDLIKNGDVFTITLEASDEEVGTLIPYSISDIELDYIDELNSNDDLTGNFIVNESGTSSISFTVNSCVFFQQSYQFNLTLDNGQDSVSTTIDGGIIQQLGGDVLSLDAAEGDYYGLSVAINGYGNIIATGGPFSDANGEKSGRVRVYQLDGGNWVQLGQDVDGESEGDYSGNKIDISDDGTIIAVSGHLSDDSANSAGHVRIFRIDNNTWTKIGQNIVGESAEDKSGRNLALNSSGSIVAISSQNSDLGSGDVEDNYGKVKVYQNENDNWVQLGQDINGQNLRDEFGWSVSINDVGNIVAVGSRSNDDSGNNAGQVKVFEIINNSWVQIGQDINGEGVGDNLGHGLSLNGDGTIVAVGAPRADDNGSNSGHVKVYQFDGNQWVQLGSNIDGEVAGDLSGNSVSLNDSGDIIIIGSYTNDSCGVDSGHVRIFKYNGSDWGQIGPHISGTSAGDWCGSSVDISSDGTRFVVGEPKAGDVVPLAGKTRVFEVSL